MKEYRPAAGPPGMMTQLLGRVVSVRPDEVAALLAAFAYNFLLFTAYYILRPLRDSMGITGGVRMLDDLFWFTFIAMLLAMPLFGWLCGRYRRAVFLPWTYGFFILNLLGFWSTFRWLDSDVWTARVFFVWVSVFNLFVVSVFWSFMADLFDREQAKRMFAFIAGGASTGAIMGSGTTAFFAEAVGDVNLLVVSAALLGATLVPMRFLMGWSRRQGESGDRPEERPIGGNPFAGAALVVRSGYLMGISVFVFLMVTVSTFLYLQQAELLARFYPDGGARTAFLGRIDLAVNLLAVGLQLLAVGRLTARFGVTLMLASIPLMLAAGFVLLAVEPVLATLVAVMIARRVGQYAITRPCREMLFTTVSRETKYKAKNFIDTVVYRGGDALSASAHEAVIKAFALGLSGIAWLGAGVAAIAVGVAVVLGRRHERTAPAAAPAAR
jgi:AAA family ATP:ADP antiporter